MHQATETRTLSGVARQRRHNLPVQLTSFVGRENDIDTIRTRLANPECRLLTLVGPGGIGKTRLALAAAEGLLDIFDDGVHFAALQPLISAGDIALAIATAINFQFRGEGKPEEQLLSFLHGKHMLLVLDNFEHLLDGASLVYELLHNAPRVKCLATSREPLKLTVEWRYEVGAMRVPETAYADVTQYTAVQLFETRAHQIRDDFTLGANRGGVIRICQLVGGMPLGLELAAALIDTLPPDKIADEIEHDLSILVSNAQNMSPRHRSMRAVLDQSFRILDATQRDIFTCLCLFRGGFSLEAARAVAGADTHSLTTLINKSLVQRAPENRYSIHELLRQSGEAILRDNPADYQDTRTRHTKFYCELLAELDVELTSGDGQAASRLIEPDLSNIDLAWNWALRQAMFDELDAAEHGLFLFREYQNRFIEVGTLYDKAVQSLRRFAACPKRDFLLANILMRQSWNSLRFGRLEQGLHQSNEGWDLLVRNQLPPKATTGSDPRAPLIIIHTLQGNLDVARELGQEMLAFNVERGDDASIGTACYVLTAVELAAGSHEQVREYGEQGYDALEKVSHRYLQAYLLNNWGNSEKTLGNFEKAKRLFTESYNNMRFLDAPEGMATALNHIAYTELEQGNHNAARTIFEQNVQTYRDIGDNGGLARTLAGLAHVAILQKTHAQAAQLLSEALDTAGSTLGNVTLSILICASLLFLEEHLLEPAQQVLTLVLNHPAANQKNRDEAQRLIAAFDLDQTTSDSSSVSTEVIIGVVKRYLTNEVWQTHDSDLLCESLSVRELDVLRLLDEGLRNREIADELTISLNTVKTHLKNIYQKLGVENRIQAIQRTRELNIL